MQITPGKLNVECQRRTEKATEESEVEIEEQNEVKKCQQNGDLVKEVHEQIEEAEDKTGRMKLYRMK